MEFTWGNLLTLAATTGIVTALLNQGLGWLRDWRASSEKRKANAGYLALRAAVLLEAYADSCSDLAGEINTYESTDGHAGEAITELPEVPAFPIDDDSWRATASDLLERCLSFPNKVIASQKVIQAATEWGNGEEIMQQCLEESVARGLEAWGLAADLRKRYGFEPHSLVYDYADHLRRMAEKLNERRKKQEEANEKMWADIAEPEVKPITNKID